MDYFKKFKAPFFFENKSSLDVIRILIARKPYDEECLYYITEIFRLNYIYKNCVFLLKIKNLIKELLKD